MTTPSNHVDGRTAAIFGSPMAIMVALVVASRIDAVGTTTPNDQIYNVRGVDESGEPVVGAKIEYAETVDDTNVAGKAELTRNGSEVVVAHASRMISDAGVLGSPETQDATPTAPQHGGPGRRTHRQAFWRRLHDGAPLPRTNPATPRQQ